METSSFSRLMELRDSGDLEEAVRESELLFSSTADPNERASLLTGEHVCLCILGRLAEARDVLRRMKDLAISDLEVRLNAEFCEPCLLVDEGHLEEGIAAFAGMLKRYPVLLSDQRFRYLYEDIQFRRAWCTFSAGRYADALVILREATAFRFERLADEQRLFFALGVCLEETGDRMEAKQDYFRVASFAMNNDLEREARYRLARLLVGERALAQARKQLEMILQDCSVETATVPQRSVYAQLAIVCDHLGDQIAAKRYKHLAQ